MVNCDGCIMTMTPQQGGERKEKLEGNHRAGVKETVDDEDGK